MFLIQDFILEFEMNGLTGYFYNRLTTAGRMIDTVSAMRRYHLPELADLLFEAVQLFREFSPEHEADNWAELITKYDPGNRLHAINQQIILLDDYGISKSAI
jgi:hypothetical protein